jgi:acetoacetate decarboxylase
MATGTMGFKHKALDLKSVRAGMEKPNYLLKIIPHVDGTPLILELADGASGARAARAAAAWP